VRSHDAQPVAYHLPQPVKNGHVGRRKLPGIDFAKRPEYRSTAGDVRQGYSLAADYARRFLYPEVLDGGERGDSLAP